MVVIGEAIIKLLNTHTPPEKLKIEKENMITDINIIKENKLKNMDEIKKNIDFTQKM